MQPRKARKLFPNPLRGTVKTQALRFRLAPCARRFPTSAMQGTGPERRAPKPKEAGIMNNASELKQKAIEMTTQLLERKGYRIIDSCLANASAWWQQMMATSFSRESSPETQKKRGFPLGPWTGGWRRTMPSPGSSSRANRFPIAESASTRLPRGLRRREGHGPASHQCPGRGLASLAALSGRPASAGLFRVLLRLGLIIESFGSATRGSSRRFP